MFKARTFFRPLDAAVALLVGAASCWGFLAFTVSYGAKAVVYVSNKKFAWYDLSAKKQEITLTTRIGPVKIEIGDGSARVISSPCPNKLCVKTGSIRHSHEEVICVPAQVIIVLESAGEGKGKGGVDAITF